MVPLNPAVGDFLYKTQGAGKWEPFVQFLPSSSNIRWQHKMKHSGNLHGMSELFISPMLYAFVLKRIYLLIYCLLLSYSVGSLTHSKVWSDTTWSYELLIISQHHFLYHRVWKLMSLFHQQVKSRLVEDGPVWFKWTYTEEMPTLFSRDFIS